MATATIQSVKVIKVAPATPMDVGSCHDRPMGITRILGTVEVVNPPRPIPDARGTLSNERLKAIAEKHQPPQEWYEGEEEQLF